MNEQKKELCSERKKLTDRTFKMQISMLFFAILLCIIAMASSAFALFTSDVVRTTELKAATWKVQAIQTEKDGDV